MYSKVKSKFIREKIKERKWESWDYIDGLIRIERLVLGEYFGWGTGYIIHSCKADYPKEWDIIYRELKPKEFKKLRECEKKEEKRERKENEEFEKQEQRERRELKKDWIKAGGT